jgi:hypothetical protein
MSLFALFIQIVAIVAEPIAASPRFAFPLRYIAARRTRAVVVMNALMSWFLFFVHGIERTCCWHGGFPFF